MKKIPLRIYAAPVALLLLAGGIATPSASADTKDDTVSADFAYDVHAPAEITYARLQRAAQKLCTTPGVRTIAMRRHEDACVASVVADGISRIGRSDIALIHTRARG